MFCYILSKWYNKIFYQHDVINYYTKIICKRMCVWWVSYQSTYIYISRYIINIMEAAFGRLHKDGGTSHFYGFHYVDDVSAYVNVCVLMRHSSNTHTFTYHFDIIIYYIILIKSLLYNYLKSKNSYSLKIKNVLGYIERNRELQILFIF